MAFEELQDRLKSEWQQTADRLNENPAVIALKDRYENLSPFGQKITIYSAVGFLVLVFGMVPYNTYMASSDSLTEYEAKRSLIRDLLRTHKEAQEIPAGLQPPAVSDVRSRVEGILASSQILPEQQRGVAVLPAQGGLINANLVAGIVQVTLGQLNIRQVVNLGTDLSSMQGVKLKDLVLDASPKDSRYFDVVYRLLVFKSDTGGGNATGGEGDTAAAPNGAPPPARPNLNRNRGN